MQNGKISFTKYSALCFVEYAIKLNYKTIEEKGTKITKRTSLR